MSEVNTDPHEYDFVKVAATETTINGPYDLAVWLGDNRVEGLQGYGKGIQRAIDYLVKRKSISGSAISEAASGKTARDRDHLLAESIDVLDSTVEAYYAGELKPSNLSAEAYTILHVTLGVQGPNTDFKGFSESENTEETLERMWNLLWLTGSNFYDGARRTISKMYYHGRHGYIHLVDSHITGNGGGNFVIFDKDHDNSSWSTMNSVRKEQNADLRLSEDGGHWVLLNVLNPDKEYALELTGKTDTLGKWAHHSARSIRTATNSSLKIVFDDDSVANKRPWDKNVGFEDAVGTISNLMTAFFAKPVETIRMIEEIRLNEVLPGWNSELARELAQKMADFKKVANDAVENNKKHFGNDYVDPYPSSLYESLEVDGVDTKGWGSFLAKFDEVLAAKGGREKGSFMNDRDAWKFKNSEQMAVFFRLFSPVSAERMPDIVPKPEKREVVEGAYSAGSMEREEFEIRMRSVVKTLGDVAEEMKSKGDNHFEDVLETVGTLKKLYKFLEE